MNNDQLQDPQSNPFLKNSDTSSKLTCQTVINLHRNTKVYTNTLLIVPYLKSHDSWMQNDKLHLGIGPIIHKQITLRIEQKKNKNARQLLNCKT